MRYELYYWPSTPCSAANSCASALEEGGADYRDVARPRGKAACSE